VQGSKLIDQTIRRRFPHPIAAAWHRVSLATTDADKIKRLLACLEVYARTLAGVLVADYLTGPPNDSVEKFLHKLDKPSLGHWIGTIRSIIKYQKKAKTVAPFIPEAIDWYLTKGRPSDQAKLLDELVQLRNDEAHGRALSAAETAARATRLLADMRRLFTGCGWLAAYRPFRVLTLSLSRRGGFRGQVQFLTGTEALTEPLNATWSARLFENIVYVTNPAGDRFLEVSPLFMVMHDDGPRADRTFLFNGTKKSKMLLLRNDSTGKTEAMLVEGEERELPWDEWLADRDARIVMQDNPSAGEPFEAKTYSAGGGGGGDADGLSLPGDRFDGRSVLGKGGMATVYLVWDRWEEREFALKVLDDQLNQEDDFRERFKREARTMKKLNHPNILRVEETSQLDDGRLYLKLPVLMGGTLSDRVKAGATPEDQLITWARQTLSALKYMHERQVVHRDIKPSNFLLDDEGNVYLSDFGIALGSADTRLTRSLEMMGSLAYMSPEQRRGMEAEEESDIYSLGLVLHELATGKSGGTQPGVGVDGIVGDLIKQMCTPVASDRPTAEEALMRLPAETAPPPPPPPDPMFTVRGPEGQTIMTIGELARAVQDAPELPWLVWQAGWDAWKAWQQIPELTEMVHGPPPVDRVGLVAIPTTTVEPSTFGMEGRQVTLSRGFVIGDAPVGAGLWQAVMMDDDGLDDAAPIIGVSWYQAIEFCNLLSEKTGLEPAYSFGEATPRKKRNSIDAQGRMLYGLVPPKLLPQILSTFGDQTMFVVQFEPDRLGEVPGVGQKTIDAVKEGWDKDKHFDRPVILTPTSTGWRLPTEAEWYCGVEHNQASESDPWEWVWDADGHPKFAVDPMPLGEDPVTDPVGADKGPRRIIRRGPARHCRVPDNRSPDLCFRVARSTG